jgi:hypothetical protein
MPWVMTNAANDNGGNTVRKYVNHAVHTTGTKYEATQGMDTAEIAGLVRAEVKAAIKAGTLPKGLKVSIRTDKYSMGSSIRIRVVSCPYQVLSTEALEEACGRTPVGGVGYVRACDTTTDEAKAVIATLTAMGEAYNWSHIDSMSDLYNTRFHLSVEHDGDLCNAERNAYMAHDANKA